MVISGALKILFSMSGMGGGLHHHPLLPHLGARQVERRILQGRCADRFSGGSEPAVPISILRTLPHEPGHPGKYMFCCTTDHSAETVSGKRMPGIDDLNSWHPLSVFRFFRHLFRICFTTSLSVIIIKKGGACLADRKNREALCRKHYRTHLFCQRNTKPPKFVEFRWLCSSFLYFFGRLTFALAV